MSVAETWNTYHAAAGKESKGKSRSMKPNQEDGSCSFACRSFVQSSSPAAFHLHTVHCSRDLVDLEIRILEKCMT